MTSVTSSIGIHALGICIKKIWMTIAIDSTKETWLFLQETKKKSNGRFRP